MTEVVYVVKGNDPVLRGRVADELVRELLGDDDRTLALEEFVLPPGRDGDDETRAQLVAGAVNAATSPPFMTSRRVVVVQNAGALKADTAAPLVGYFDAPLDTSVVVLVAGGDKLPTALSKKLQEIGAVDRAPASEKTEKVLELGLRDAPISLRDDARKAIESHLGEDAGRIGALLEVLAAAYGGAAPLSVEEVEPYLGGVGAVPSYGLTNAVEAGDAAAALEVLHRLFDAPTTRDPTGMHPLQVLGVLTSYYRRLLRLDDPAVRSTEDAIAALGGRMSQYPARKALASARALGTDGIRQAFDLLHQADLDVKGARGIPAEIVMEVLVARLARLTRSSTRGAARAGSARRR